MTLQIPSSMLASPGGSTLPTTTSYGTAIQLDGYRSMGTHVVNAPITFTLNPTGAIDTGELILALQADGTNLPNFGPFTLASTQAYDNTAGRKNLVSFFREFGDYYYAVVLGVFLDTTPPALSSIVVPNASRSSVIFTFNESLAPTFVPLSSDFAITGHTTTGSPVLSGATVTVALTAPFVFGETARTASYTPGLTANKLQDLAGNLVVAFSGQAVTNNAAQDAPNAPTALTVGTITSTSVALSWSAPANDATHSAPTDYVVEYRTPSGSGGYTTFSHTVSAATSIVVTGLTASTGYGFHVAATNAAGTSAFTTESTATTSAGGSFLRFSSLESPMFEGGSGPYTYTADTYGRRGHGSSLKMPAGVACSVTQRIETIPGSGDSRFGMDIATDNTADPAQYDPTNNANTIISSNTSGNSFMHYRLGSGASDTSVSGAAFTSVAHFKQRYSKDTSNNFSVDYSLDDGATWVNVTTGLAGAAVDYFVKFTCGNNAGSMTVSFLQTGMV